MSGCVNCLFWTGIIIYIIWSTVSTDEAEIKISPADSKMKPAEEIFSLYQLALDVQYQVDYNKGLLNHLVSRSRVLEAYFPAKQALILLKINVPVNDQIRFIEYLIYFFDERYSLTGLTILDSFDHRQSCGISPGGGKIHILGCKKKFIHPLDILYFIKEYELMSEVQVLEKIDHKTYEALKRFC